MQLNTIGRKATAATAILTLLGSVVYTSSIIWSLAHAQYAQASAVEYLFQKQIEVDIWRYEDELDTLNDIAAVLEDEDPNSSKLAKVKRRIDRLENRLDRLVRELEDN